MSDSPKNTISTYLHIFEGRIKYLHTRLSKECKKPKENRSKSEIKMYISEIKKLKTAVNLAKLEHAVSCPHCGKPI